MRRIRPDMAGIVAVAAIIIVAGAANANTFYVDPVTGSAGGDGSAGNPWQTLQQVFAGGLIESHSLSGAVKNAGAPVQAGDTILLRSGYHGDLNTSQWFNDDYITVEAEDGHTPVLRRINISGASKWIFRGLTITPSAAATYGRVTMVNFYSRNTSSGTCSDMTIEDSFIYSVLDSSAWSAQNWVDLSASAINLGHNGTRLTARNNRMLNVDFGVTVAATDCLVEYNEIANFSGDGMRVMMHGAVVQYNLIKDCYNVDDNHDDGIQGYYSLSPGQPVRDVTLRGNIIINRTDNDRPHQGGLQGIGCFDGPFINWVVENNVIITDHWHGITLYRAGGCRIINNTVFNPWYQDGLSGMQTWIDLTPESSGGTNYIRNNITPRMESVSGMKVVIEDNLIIPQAANADYYFVDYSNNDYHLAAGNSLTIDAGNSDLAPSIDADEFLRPAGLGIDMGAYEFGSGLDAAVVADPGGDRTVYDTDGDGMATFTMDGSASVGNNGALVSWEWLFGLSVLATGETAPMTMPVGTFTFTLRVTDEYGSIGTEDITITIATGGLAGDADSDGDVDLDDFVILKTNFGTATGAGWADGDFDGDGDVDLDDFVLLKGNFGS